MRFRVPRSAFGRTEAPNRIYDHFPVRNGWCFRTMGITMQRIFLTGTQLKAVQLSAAINDVRHFLNGVHLEATRNETRLVATDGSMMVAFRAAAANELEQSITTLTVPNEVVKQVRPAKGASDVLTIEIEGWRYTMVFGQLRIGFEPVAGAFPDYRRIVATKASGVVGHYDPDRLAVMKRIGNMLGRSRGAMPYVHHNGEGDAVVTLGCVPTFVGVLKSDPKAARKSEPKPWPALSNEDVNAILAQLEANPARLPARSDPSQVQPLQP
ncbi:DNA polymerase III subunit beta (plasmid) [Burkholderia gladioli BSR3]|uniref:Beta sliding clamp n=2 Tax=Burkholderia gladioli TaxID=28095 RepID=F2LSR5_BURGS|nr:DNA polymerase III subunit beta [Burkholderia gladioli BSR3]